jgi:hypothetical protein
MTADGPLAVSAPLPIPSYFSDVSDDNKNPSISDLRLFEDGKVLGPAHSLGTTIKSAGRGIFSHWGHQIYFSGSDSTSPKTNGRAYAARFRVYPVLEFYLAAVLAPIAFFAGLCAIHDFLVFLGRIREGEPSWTRRVVLGAGIILLLTIGAVGWLRVAGQTAYLKTPVVWSVAVLCGLGMAFLIWLRLDARPTLDTFKDWTRRLAASQKPKLTIVALLRLAGLTFVYSMVLIFIGTSLAVQRSSSGELKINFEYKVF